MKTFEDESEELDVVRSNIRQAAREAYNQEIEIDSFVEWALSSAVFHGAGCNSTTYEKQKAFWKTLDVNTQIELDLVFEGEFNKVVDELETRAHRTV